MQKQQGKPKVVRMFITRVSLGLVVGLFCIPLTFTEAKPAKKVPLLTPMESYCHAWGDLAFKIAVARDSDVSLAVTLDTVRRGFTKHDPTMQELGVALTYQIYSVDASPGKVQRYFETGCILHGKKY